jgi:hypothetical protein
MLINSDYSKYNQDDDDDEYSYTSDDNKDMDYRGEVEYTSSKKEKRVISDYFTNIDTFFSRNSYSPPKKKIISYIFKNNSHSQKCDLTIDDITYQNETSIDVQMKLNSIDKMKFSLGDGQTFSLSKSFSKWIMNDYEPYMWREVGIHIYITFGNEWKNFNLLKAKAVIDQCIEIWKNIKEKVYINFCEIVIEKEYTDMDPVPEKLKNQINKAMWLDTVIEPYQAGFKVFKDWYISFIIDFFNTKKSLKNMDIDHRTNLFKHMVNFCGLYTMHNRIHSSMAHIA